MGIVDPNQSTDRRRGTEQEPVPFPPRGRIDEKIQPALPVSRAGDRSRLPRRDASLARGASPSQCVGPARPRKPAQAGNNLEEAEQALAITCRSSARMRPRGSGTPASSINTNRTAGSEMRSCPFLSKRYDMTRVTSSWNAVAPTSLWSWRETRKGRDGTTTPSAASET